MGLDAIFLIMSVKIKLEYRFLVFLYAYMHQIDLSLDRSRWVGWSELREYYKSQINPVIVSDQLLKISNQKLKTTPISLVVKEPSVLRRIKEGFYRLIVKKHYLMDYQVLYCCQLLHQFNLLLNRDFSEYSLVAEKLRIDTATFYSYLLAPKLSGKDLRKAMLVEHFMQNEILSVVKIDVFATGVLSK